jgi:hypothetical protein
MKASLLIAILWLSAGQVEPASDPKAQSAARLKFMNETAAKIEVHEDGNVEWKVELAAQPVLRWDNPRSFIVDAATFVWLADHRPQAIGGIWIKNGNSFFDLQSLSTRFPRKFKSGTFSKVSPSPRDGRGRRPSCSTFHVAANTLLSAPGML